MTTEFKKTLSVYKSEASRGVKYSNCEISKKFATLYRNALNNIKNEFQLQDLLSYRSIFWNAFVIKDVKIINAVFESIDFEFIK